jgi:hypothetical protein
MKNLLNDKISSVKIKYKNIEMRCVKIIKLVY